MRVGGTPKYIPISDRKERPSDVAVLENKITPDVKEKRGVKLSPNSFNQVPLNSKEDSSKGSEAV